MQQVKFVTVALSIYKKIQKGIQSVFVSFQKIHIPSLPLPHTVITFLCMLLKGKVHSEAVSSMLCT